MLRNRLGLYWSLIKSLQTALLLITGLAGYMSGAGDLHLLALVGLCGSLFLAISGSTILNMWYDRDIDAVMGRTCTRPLPSGQIASSEALALGLILGSVGVAWAVAIDALFGIIVFGGLFFDVVIYTILLKRRTCWSVVWGGIAGGMPVLAGRALAVGSVDWIGLMLMLAVLFWIPTHILTFSMRNFDDYQRAGIPTFPSAYGFQATRVIIAVSSVLAAVSMGIAAYGVGLTAGYLALMAVLSVGLFFLAVTSTIRPSKRLNFGLFKYASMFMLGSMILLMLDAF